MDAESGDIVFWEEEAQRPRAVLDGTEAQADGMPHGYKFFSSLNTMLSVIHFISGILFLTSLVLFSKS